MSDEKMEVENTAEERPELDQKLSELEILRQSLEDAKAGEKKIYDQYLRLGADFENYRKRMESRVIEARRGGKEDLLLELLVVADSVHHAIEATKLSSDMEALKKGLGLLWQVFERFLGDHGVKAITAVGEPFDPHKHEALLQEESDSAEEGAILSEIQRGYTLDDRVIRTAKVKVSAKSNDAAKAGDSGATDDHEQDNRD